MRRVVAAGLGLVLAGLLLWRPETGLHTRPLDAHGWARLAWERQRDGAPAREVAAAVVFSMRAAPTDRPLLFARLPLAAAAWDGFTAAERTVVLDQARLAWAVDRRRARASAPGPQGARLLARSLTREERPAAAPPPGSAD